MTRHHTPLRYPGGKQKLSPFVAEIIRANDLVGCEYVEPYAGGAGVAMELLMSGLVSHVHLNDLSAPIYAFWRSVLTRSDEFCRRIAGVSLTVEEWKKQRDIFSQPKDFGQLDVGFSLFYLNRCNRSGIPTGGLIGGVGQVGDWLMDARFTRKELIRRVEAIAAKRQSVTVKKMDAIAFIRGYLPGVPRDAFVYCDPPYFKKADRLYLNHYLEEDHRQVAIAIQKHLHQHWIVSYDGAPEIVQHYSKRRHFFYDLQYNAHRAYKGTEVFFFSDSLDLPAESVLAPIDAGLKSMAS